MKSVSHHSAKPSHYNKEVKHYDSFNEKNSILINQTDLGAIVGHTLTPIPRSFVVPSDF